MDLIQRQFTQDQITNLVNSTIENIKTLENVKGGEYAGDKDRLHNFRHNAEDCGTRMELIWRIYAGKHWDALSNYIRDLLSNKERPRSEPIEGRIDDLIVYLILLKAIIQDGKQ